MKYLWLLILALAVIALALGLGVPRFRDFFNDNQGAMQATLVITLVLVTILYAWHTGQLATEAKKQAEATQELARQAQRQLHANFRPIIVFTPVPSLDGISLAVISLSVENIGAGPALNLRCRVKIDRSEGGDIIIDSDDKKRRFQASALPNPAGDYAGQDVHTKYWERSIVPPITSAEKVNFIAVYQDVHGNCFKSEQSFPWEGNGLGPGALMIKQIDKEKTEQMLKEDRLLDI
ncbi:MAG: hypothetical protein HY666_05330 [Chloroflexi bacterium]|nr:hypothetical protein [Chloroflexota bacterium]